MLNDVNPKHFNLDEDTTHVFEHAGPTPFVAPGDENLFVRSWRLGMILLAIHIKPRVLALRGSSRSTLGRILLLLLLLIESGCSFSDIEPRSHIIAPEGVSRTLEREQVKLSPAGWPARDWWRRYQDPQLDSLVDEAIAGSPTLRSAAARVHRARALEAIEDAELLPSISTDMSVTRERFSSNGTTPAPAKGTWQNVYQGTLNVGYELDFWGKNRSAIEAAIGRRRAVELDEQATALILSASVVQTYIALQNAYDQIDVAQMLLDQQEKIEQLTRKRFSAKLGTEIDIKQSQATLPASKANIAALMEQVELDRNKLASLLGKGPDRGLRISRPHMVSSDGVVIPTLIPAELIGHRPDVVAQRWKVEALAHEIDVAKARFYPNVNLTAFIGLQSLAFDTFNDHSSRILGASPALSLPIFEGGRLRGNLAAQDAAYDEAVEQYNQTVVDAMGDIADQLSSLRWLKERIAQQTEAVDTAQAAADLVTKRYAAGLATYLQVLSTQNLTLEQKRQQVDLQSRALSLQAELSRALGGGYLPELPTTDSHPSVADQS